MAPTSPARQFATWTFFAKSRAGTFRGEATARISTISVHEELKSRKKYPYGNGRRYLKAARVANCQWPPLPQGGSRRRLSAHNQKVQPSKQILAQKPRYPTDEASIREAAAG